MKASHLLSVVMRHGHTGYSKSTGLFRAVQNYSRELLWVSPLEGCTGNLDNIILKVMVMLPGEKDAECDSVLWLLRVSLTLEAHNLSRSEMRRKLRLREIKLFG